MTSNDVKREWYEKGYNTGYDNGYDYGFKEGEECALANVKCKSRSRKGMEMICDILYKVSNPDKAAVKKLIFEYVEYLIDEE